MNEKLAIIGESDDVIAFKAGGVDAFIARDSKEAREILRTLAKDYAVIFLTEKYMKELSAYLKRFNETPYPIITSIPTGKNDYGEVMLRTAMEKALGVDILFGREDK